MGLKKEYVKQKDTYGMIKYIPKNLYYSLPYLEPDLWIYHVLSKNEISPLQFNKKFSKDIATEIASNKLNTILNLSLNYPIIINKQYWLKDNLARLLLDVQRLLLYLIKDDLVYKKVDIKTNNHALKVPQLSPQEINDVSLQKQLFQLNHLLKKHAVFHQLKKKTISHQKGLKNLTKSRIEYKKEYRIIERYLGYLNSANIQNTLLYGSYSSGDPTINYSDLDVAIIIRESCLKSKEAFKQTKKIILKAIPAIYMIDPLAHHRFEIILNSEFKRFQLSHLPINVLQNSRVFSSHQDIPLNVQIVQEQLNPVTKIGRRLIETFRMHIQKERFPTAYHFKGHVSEMMLVPALYLQALGMDISKKDSFDKAQEYVPTKFWNIIDEFTNLRSQWRVKNILQNVPSTFVDLESESLREQTYRVNRYFAKKSYHLPSKSTEKRYIRQSLELTEWILKDIFESSRIT